MSYNFMNTGRKQETSNVLNVILKSTSAFDLYKNELFFLFSFVQRTQTLTDIKFDSRSCLRRVRFL